MMCFSDRSIFLAHLVTILLFGALNDHSTFTPTDTRTIVLRHGLFGGTRCRLGGSITSSVCVLVAAGNVLTQQQQQ
jgi:hypothetical protein